MRGVGAETGVAPWCRTVSLVLSEYGRVNHPTGGGQKCGYP